MPQGCRTQFTYFFDHADTVIGQSPLLSLYHSSITTVATLFIFLLATLLLKLFGSIHAWKALCLISSQYYSPALQAGCVNGPETVCCCQLETNWEQVVFQMSYV
jgi:hypothetical protein